MPDRAYDIVLHGATGFVGRLVGAHLAEHAGTARVALSGRSEQRLKAVRDELSVDWPLLVTDATDRASVATLAGSATVVATTVGPYGKYGLPLVEACADAGTSYCDLTGETLFVRDSADAAHQRARSTGARIVHSAGFDSVPSDLGVLMLHQRVQADGEGTLGQTALMLVSVRGGLSGGTVDSIRTELAAVGADPSRRGILGDPYALSPDRAAGPVRRGREGPGAAGPRPAAGPVGGAVPVRPARQQDRAAQQRAARARARAGVPVPGAPGGRRRAGRTGRRGHGVGRARRLPARHADRAYPGPAGPGAAGARGRALGADPAVRPLPGRVAHRDQHRRPLRGHRRGEGRPGLRRDRGDVRAERALPGPGPAGRTGRRAHSGRRARQPPGPPAARARLRDVGDPPGLTRVAFRTGVAGIRLLPSARNATASRTCRLGRRGRHGSRARRSGPLPSRRPGLPRARSAAGARSR